MGFLFLFGLILWGWAEMSAFIFIGNELGGLLTLLGVFMTAIIGLSLVKSQGVAVMSRIRADFAKGQAPMGSVADSIALAVGGILMLIPGYVTDGIGLLLFVPGLRTIAGAWILSHLVNKKKFTSFIYIDPANKFSDSKDHQSRDDNDIIEGDATEHRTPQNRLNRS